MEDTEVVGKDVPKGWQQPLAKEDVTEAVCVLSLAMKVTHLPTAV